MLLHEFVLASPSTALPSGPGKKANTIICLQYLKKWKGGSCAGKEWAAKKDDDGKGMVKVRCRKLAAEISSVQ